MLSGQKTRMRGSILNYSNAIHSDAGHAKTSIQQYEEALMSLTELSTQSNVVSVYQIRGNVKSCLGF